VFDAPDALTLITVLYVPAASPVLETLALMLSISVVVVPLMILRPSHAAVSVNVHVKVPPVGFDTVMGLASGEEPPAVPEKLKLVGLSRMLGVTVRLLVPPVTTKVTGTDVTCILLFFSAMEIRTVPL
jgi:hypothetical protein